MLKHLDLFSGIGGFALAAKMVGGIETTQFVEIDPYCQKVLAKNFPGIPIHGDISTFTAPAGYFDLITGGFPCQPHSTAGKRKASKDDRDLWPQLYRVICEVQPRWCVFENVRGLLSSESGRFFRRVLWDLSQAGFNAEWAVIPASDMGASHRRERVWIVAYSKHNGHFASKTECKRMEQLTGWQKKQTSFVKLTRSCRRPLVSKKCDDNTPNSNSARLEAWKFPAIEQSSIAQLKRLDGRDGRGFTTQPLLCRGDDGLSRGLDRHRNQRIKALGNSVVPQVAAIPLQRVLELCSTSSSKSKKS